jgi:hypothetical protein
MAYYFRYLPNLEYINRNTSQDQISNYTRTKNLFKRGKIRDDIFGNLIFFTKYDVIGDERPDNVAEKIYGDSSLDWIVLLSNNIVNVYDEWPMSQETFDKYLLEKYNTYDAVYGTHHYETIEVKDSSGNIMVKSGLTVPSSFNIRYFDYGLGEDKQQFNITIAISNYDYEIRKEEKKRNIFLLKSDYVPVIMNDMENTMPYKEGGDQYVDPTLKRVDDIRLYEN